mmetsp:Transcript_41683/g.50745  ORF Transcript_41683/g.50745 Transcript_41683/m.50745 type:complete len:83 (+) Transcript_41683:1095-1343(+)
MTRTHLNDLPQHTLRMFNTLATALQRYLTILTRRNILINLNITATPLLQVIDSYALLANDPTHVHFGTRINLTLHSTTITIC